MKTDRQTRQLRGRTADFDDLKKAAKDPLSPKTALEHQKPKLEEGHIEADEERNKIEAKLAATEEKLVGVLGGQQDTIQSQQGAISELSSTLTAMVAGDKTPGKKACARGACCIVFLCAERASHNAVFSRVCILQKAPSKSKTFLSSVQCRQ